MSANRGLFITLEGIEGVGKSTHLAYISELLQQEGHQVIATREPGGTYLGEELRKILLAKCNTDTISDNTELLLMFAARSQHLDQVIRPGLANGSVVISDRFTDSSFAYQGGGRGIDNQRIRQLQQWLHADLVPDLTMLLDLPAKVALARADRRGQADRLESESVTFFANIRNFYLQLAAEEPGRIVVIDAYRDLEAIQTDIRRLLKDQGLI